MSATSNPFQGSAFLTSAFRPGDFPPDQGTEVAFAGRSNAGKSSALNAIAGHKGLAYVSKAPGRTQLINFFSVRDTPARLVDLPGYGHAKVASALKQQWDKTLTAYVEKRRALRGLVLVMDIRHPLTDADWQLIDWVSAHGRRVHCLLTKADKLSRGAAKNVELEVGRALAERVPNATVSRLSVLNGEGVENIRALLVGWLR